ncbi:hypothetical protein EPD60_16320 [Flaviaesturariibacter flavus]|uniref:Uncharacterized protein n=1 Tax=Flaviaesturariibacter flavus TaxID=2502780 RepID=A0A4R1B680_9BACT|nr:hypothetical protein [Flaviaesturariibacter flavus]TCJ12117.1 hypothetical protein EPD60_16320 [Flaviaesturariibacter flavus]
MNPHLFFCMAAIVVGVQQSEAQTPVAAPQRQQTAFPKAAPAAPPLYENKRLGLSFLYPGSWKKDPAETEQRNLDDEPSTIGIDFRDSVTGAIFRLEYYLQPSGRLIYENALASAARQKARRRTLDNAPSVETVCLLTKNGRGEPLPEQLELRILDAPDQRNGKNLRITFQYPAAYRAGSVKQFEELLASFRFVSN